MNNTNLSFKGCTFGNGTTFENRQENTIKFNDCEFNCRIDLSQPKASKQSTNLYLEDCHFHKTVKFYSRIFSDTSFENTTFDGVADFWNVNFEKETVFYKTTFNDNVVFSEAKLNKICDFRYSTFRAIAIFRDATFKKGLNLAHANFAFQSSFSTHKLEIGKFEQGSISLEDERETFRLLKNDAINSNNKIGSLDFYEREMNAYRKSIHSKSKLSIKQLFNVVLALLFIIAILPGYSGLLMFRFFLIAFISLVLLIKYPKFYFKKHSIKLKNGLNSLKDKIKLVLNYEICLPRLTSGNWWILFFQRIFGNFNQSWGLSLFSTLVIASILFSCYNLTFSPHLFEWGFTSWASWGNVISDYMLFLWPGRDFEAISNDLGPLTIPMDILSRVLIGIGLYQTLRSFRKLG